MLLVRAFKELGHQLYIAASGEEALPLWELHGEDIDAVITDVIMPGLSGPRLVEKLRASRINLPVIYISGYASDRVAKETLEQEHTEFMQKPFDLRELIATIDRLLLPGRPASLLANRDEHS